MKNLLHLHYEPKFLHHFGYHDKEQIAEAHITEFRKLIKKALGITSCMVKFNHWKEIRRENKLLKLQKSLTFDEYP